MAAVSASVAPPSGGPASMTPRRLKSQDTAPLAASCPLRKSTRMLVAVRFLFSVRHSTMTGTWCGAKPSYVTVS